MSKGLKITTGVLKASLGCAAFAGGCIINTAFKAVSGGVGLPPGEGNPIQEAKELSKYWFESAKNDFEEAAK